MLDWVGSLRIREKSEQRVSLTLTRSTRAAGWVIAGLGTWLTLAAWSLSAWLALLPVALTAFGLLLASLRRELTFDRDAGVLRVDQSALGLSSRTVVPLFHLRAVVILARDEEMP